MNPQTPDTIQFGKENAVDKSWASAPATLPFSSTPSSSISDIINNHNIGKAQESAPFAKPSAYDIAMGKTNADGSPNNNKGIIAEAIDQAKTGYKQTEEGANNPDLLSGLQLIGRGMLNEASAGLRAVFSPVEAGLKVVSQLPGFHQALGALQDHVIDPVANKISDSPAIQKFMQSNPNAAEVFGNLVSIVGTIVAGKVAPEAKTIISDSASKIVDTANKVVETAKEKVTPIVDQAKVDLENKTFNNNLKDAEQSIYPKLSATEKANIPLKEKSGILGSKATPDLMANPKTKSIIESVANLPEDIRLKPSDNLAVKESKINQGISRLHQETNDYLYSKKSETQFNLKQKDNLPTINAKTGVKSKPSTLPNYEGFMKQKVLDPIEKEFGTKSVEYKEAQKGLQTSADLIKANDAHGVHEARQAFDKQFQSENPRAFAKAKASFGQLDPKTSAVIEAGRSIRTAMNDFTESLLKENDPYRARLKEESNLIQAKEEMRTRSTDQLNKNPVIRALDRNPKVKKAVNTVGGALKVGGGVDLVNHL